MPMMPVRCQASSAATLTRSSKPSNWAARFAGLLCRSSALVCSAHASSELIEFPAQKPLLSTITRRAVLTHACEADATTGTPETLKNLQVVTQLDQAPVSVGLRLVRLVRHPSSCSARIETTRAVRSFPLAEATRHSGISTSLPPRSSDAPVRWSFGKPWPSRGWHGRREAPSGSAQMLLTVGKTDRCMLPALVGFRFSSATGSRASAEDASCQG